MYGTYIMVNCVIDSLIIILYCMGLLHKLHIEDTIHAYVCSKSQHTLCHRSGYGQRECKWRFYTRTRTRTHTRTRTSKLIVAWKLNGSPWGRLDFSQKGKVFCCFQHTLTHTHTLTHSLQLLQAALGEPFNLDSLTCTRIRWHACDNSRTIGTDEVCCQATGNSPCAVTHENKN